MPVNGMMLDPVEGSRHMSRELLPMSRNKWQFAYQRPWNRRDKLPVCALGSLQPINYFHR